MAMHLDFIFFLSFVVIRNVRYFHTTSFSMELRTWERCTRK